MTGFFGKKQPRDVRDFSEMRCPVHGLVTLLSGPWTTYILWLIRTNGPMRFGQLKKQMPPISANVLTERLRMLVEAGLLQRHSEPGLPPAVSYSFTDRGHGLDALLDEVGRLALTWTTDPLGCETGGPSAHAD
jgi:DNA-binding HxlR family transcriptional regulator